MHHFIADWSPVKQFLHILHIYAVISLLIVNLHLELLRSQNASSIIQTVFFNFLHHQMKQRFSVCVQDFPPSHIYHKMFIQYFFLMINTVLEVFIPPPPFFHPSLFTWWHLFTTLCVENTSISFSPVVLTFLFQLTYQPAGFSLWLSHLSHLTLNAPSLSVYFKMFHGWSKTSAHTTQCLLCFFN